MNYCVAKSSDQNSAVKDRLRAQTSLNTEKHSFKNTLEEAPSKECPFESSKSKVLEFSTFKPLPVAFAGKNRVRACCSNQLFAQFVMNSWFGGLLNMVGSQCIIFHNLLLTDFGGAQQSKTVARD